MNRRPSLSLGALVALFVGSACSSTYNGTGPVVRDSGSTGGSVGSGGAVSTGGGVGSGGAVSTGGSVGSGGAVSTGGKGGAGSGGTGGAGGQLSADGGELACTDGGTCSPPDGGKDAPGDKSTPSDLPLDRPLIDGSGDGVFVPGACSPRGSNGQLDTQSAGSLVVAPDEKHVAFLRDPRKIDAGCLSRGAQLELGTLVVLELQPDGSACQRVVAKDVSSSSIFFSSDSRYLAFMEGVDGCRLGQLKIADADGANVRLVQQSASDDTGIGATVFFRVNGQGVDFAVPFAGGKAVSLGANADNDPRRFSNATGTAFAHISYASGSSDGVLDLIALPSGKSLALVDGAKEQIGNTIWSPRGGWLAFCHWTKDAPSASLTVIATDGSGRIDVSTNSACYGFTFSPDDAWLVYPETNSSGGTRILTYSLKDRSSVLLGELAEGDFGLAASDDSASVVVRFEPKSPTSPASKQIYGGTAGTAGSLRLLVDEPGVYDVVCAGGYVALSNGNWRLAPNDHWTVEVYPIAAGTAVTILGQAPHFEPGVAQPRLLLLQDSPSAIALASTDGSGVTAHPIPDSDYLAFSEWLGSVAVYGTAPDSTGLVTISALTSASTVTTLLASEAGAYAWAPIDAPRRVFYSRKAASAGGATGVFYTELPR